ncbi:hypothetical protein Golax_013759, partial [Gossypium laxum]|nr:hypothetical protein [Gossypium laxum]
TCSTSSSLPLTFCFELPPVEPLNPNSCNLFSLTLHHYLFIAGNLKWPSNAPQTHPFRIMDFDSQMPSLMQISAVSPATESMKLLSYPLIPHLISSDDLASIPALQITLFPSQGFSFGITAHHIILEGKTTSMFM